MGFLLWIGTSGMAKHKHFVFIQNPKFTYPYVLSYRADLPLPRWPTCLCMRNLNPHQNWCFRVCRDDRPVPSRTLDVAVAATAICRGWQVFAMMDISLGDVLHSQTSSMEVRGPFTASADHSGAILCCLMLQWSLTGSYLWWFVHYQRYCLDAFEVWLVAPPQTCICS